MSSTRAISPSCTVESYQALNDLKLEQKMFNSVSEWFDHCFKPSMRKFLIDFSKARIKSRKDTVLFLSISLQNAIGRSDWESVAYTRSKLNKFNKEDSLGYIVRSRYHENSENKRASLFHLRVDFG